MVWKYYNVAEAVRVERVYSLFERTYRHDYNFAGESHNFWECVYIENGSICVTADGRVHNLTEGDIIFHKPLELHKFFVEGVEDAKILTFSYSLEGDLCHSIENKICRLHSQSNAVMQSFLDYLHDEAVRRGIGGDSWGDISWARTVGEDAVFSQMVATYICQLILTLSQSDTDTVTSKAADAAVFTNAVDYMKLHIDGVPSVWEIAQEIGISESGLQRVFDKYAKMVVHKYLVSLKMKTATELLGQGISVCDVARRLGYSSQNNFSAAYRRETGQNPSKVKR